MGPKIFSANKSLQRIKCDLWWRRYCSVSKLLVIFCQRNQKPSICKIISDHIKEGSLCSFVRSYVLMHVFFAGNVTTWQTTSSGCIFIVFVNFPVEGHYMGCPIIQIKFRINNCWSNLWWVFLVKRVMANCPNLLLLKPITPKQHDLKMDFEIEKLNCVA